MCLYIIILLWGKFHTSAETQSSAVKQDSGLVSVGVGDNVTLRCFYQGGIAMHFSWYLQTLGSKPQLLSTIYKYDQTATMFNQFKNNSRFSVQNDEGINHLNISDVELSDSATYYCGSVRSNMVEFGEGVFLSVKESNVKAIAQQPVSESVQPGDSVTPNCTVHTETCDGEPSSIYWFRRGYCPGVIHTHDNQREEMSRRGSPTQSCVYHLQGKILPFSDAGTYYCVVASCGEILFGNKTQPDIEDGIEDLAAHIGTLVFLSIVRTGILFFFLTICSLFYIVKKWSTQ